MTAQQNRNIITSKGFTLVELLVVISIIAILAVIAIAIFSGVQSRARDARRQADVSSIAKALEAQKVAGSTVYPQIAGAWFAGGSVPAEPAGYVPQYSIVSANGTTAGKPTVWAVGTANPTAPAGTAVITVANTGSPAGAFTTFQVCALLENGTAPNIFCVPSSQ